MCPTNDPFAGSEGAGLEDFFGINNPNHGATMIAQASPTHLPAQHFAPNRPPNVVATISPINISPSTPMTMSDLQPLAQRIQELEDVIQQLYLAIQDKPRPAEIRKGQLDRYCIPLFEQHPEPSGHHMTALIRTLEMAFPTHERQELMSVVRRWFRKKREEVGLKIVAALKRMYGDLKTRKDEIEKALKEGTFDFSLVIDEARLCLEPTQALVDFCASKLSCYLARMNNFETASVSEN